MEEMKWESENGTDVMVEEGNDGSGELGRRWCELYPMMKKGDYEKSGDLKQLQRQHHGDLVEEDGMWIDE